MMAVVEIDAWDIFTDLEAQVIKFFSEIVAFELSNRDRVPMVWVSVAH